MENNKNFSISFFIPAYNCEKWIEEAVNSIMETNFEAGDELVIVNDCSTDNTAQVLEKIKQKYSGNDLKIITHDVNKGGSSARNTAISNAKNDVVFCLDSDNVLEEKSIAPLKKFMQEQNADIATFGSIRYFRDEADKTNITHVWKYKGPVFTLQNALETGKFPGASGNYMFTKESWQKTNGYLPHVHGLDTWAFGFRQLAEGFKMVTLKDTYYFHRSGIEDSYWALFTKKYNPSLIALSIVIPYIDRLTISSRNYILNIGRNTWFENLEHIPIKLLSDESYARKLKNKERNKNFFKFLSCFVPVKSWRRIVRGM